MGYADPMSEPRASYDAGHRPRSRRAMRTGRVRRTGAEAGFPGCEAVPMSAAEVAEADGPRIEYWDAEDGVAWMVREPVLPGPRGAGAPPGGAPGSRCGRPGRGDSVLRHDDVP